MKLQKGTLIKRYKRFLADVTTGSGEEITIHCPNTGAMTGCAEPGFTVYYSTSDNKKRKYANTFELAENQYGHYIGINTVKANELAVEAFEAGLIPELNGYQHVQREVKYGEENSRIDVKLTAPELPDCFIEVKSATLLLDAETQLGAFPDAVTTRGQKHLRELSRIVEEGSRAVLLFLVQHTGIKNVKVADHIDPKYAEELKKAIAQGVEIVVICTHIDPQQIKVSGRGKFINQ